MEIEEAIDHLYRLADDAGEPVDTTELEILEVELDEERCRYDEAEAAAWWNVIAAEAAVMDAMERGIALW